MKVRFTPHGQTQFLAVVEYIRNDDLGAARRFRQRAEQVLRRLERFPNSGRIVPEFPDLPYREVIVRPYRSSIESRVESSGSSGSGTVPSNRLSHPK